MSPLPYMTELQAGSYALMDGAYARIGGIDFGHALTILATVISANHADRVTVDAGFKAFATDRPFGPDVLDIPGARYEWAGDEFGYVFLDQLPNRLGLGDRVRFIPPHCDPTVNLYDRIHVCHGDESPGDMAGHGQISCRLKPIAYTLLKPTAVNSILSEVALAAIAGPATRFAHARRAGFRNTAAHRRSSDARFKGRANNIRRRIVASRSCARPSPTSSRGTTASLTIPPPRSSSRTARHSGSTQSLMTLLGPGDEILVPDPIYDAYQSPIRLTGATLRPAEEQTSGRAVSHSTSKR